MNFYGMTFADVEVEGTVHVFRPSNKEGAFQAYNRLGSQTKFLQIFIETLKLLFLSMNRSLLISFQNYNFMTKLLFLGP